MEKGPPPPTENETVPSTLAELGQAVGELRELLQRCVTLSMATAYVARRVGREQEAMIKAAGIEPAITPSLGILGEQIEKMLAATETAIRRVR